MACRPPCWMCRCACPDHAAPVPSPTARLPHHSQGLAYGLSVAEAIVSPAMPSSTARAGGIFMPIISSLAHGGGSEPGQKLLGWGWG